MHQNIHRSAQEPDNLPLSFEHAACDEADTPVLLLYGREQANAAMGIGTERMPLEIAAIPHLPFPSPPELDEQFELFRRRTVVIWPLAGPEGAVLATRHAYRIAAMGARAVGVLKPERGRRELPDLSGMHTSRLVRRRVRACVRESLDEAMSLALPERGDIAPRAVVAGPHEGNRSSVIVNAAKLLQKYIVWVEEKTCTLIALWCLHAWCVRHELNPFDISPRLQLAGTGDLIGTARALRVVSWLVPGPRLVSHTNPQFLAELASQPKSTLLLEDLTGTYFGRGEICAVLASGARRDGIYLSGKPGKKGTPLPSCFAPVAIASSAVAPQVIADHTICLQILSDTVGLEREPNVFGSAPEEVLQMRARLHALADDVVGKVDPTATKTCGSSGARLNSGVSLLQTMGQAIKDRDEEQGDLAQPWEPEEFDGADVKLLRLLYRLSTVPQPADVSTARILETVNGNLDELLGKGHMRLCPKRLAAMLEPFGLRAASIRFSDGRIARGYRLEDIAITLQRRRIRTTKDASRKSL